MKPPKSPLGKYTVNITAIWAKIKHFCGKSDFPRGLMLKTQNVFQNAQFNAYQTTKNSQIAEIAKKPPPARLTSFKFF